MASVSAVVSYACTATAVVWHKSPSCKHNMAVMQLPNLEVLRHRLPEYLRVMGMSTDVTAYTCICWECLHVQRQPPE